MDFNDFKGKRKVLAVGDAVSAKVNKALLYLTMGLTLSSSPKPVMAENTEENHTEVVDSEFKFDITYDSKSNAFLVKTNEGNFPIFENDIDYKKWQKDYNINLKEIFAEPTKINYESKDIYEHMIIDGQSDAAHYSSRANTINVYNFYIKESNRELLKKYIMEHRKISEEDALKNIENSLKTDSVEYQSIMIHESSHRDDEKFFSNTKNDLPAEYMAKLNIMTEIKASMAQAGFALQYFQKTGDLKAFDYLCCDMTNVKETLTKNPNMQNSQEFVAKAVYDSWLKEYNKPASHYVNQAYDDAVLGISSTPLFAYGSEQAAEKEYQKRCNAMLENVPYLGNVSKNLKVDFALNKDLETQIAQQVGPRAKVANILSGDAKKAKSCANSIIRVLKQIKKSGKDGIVTAKEQKKINNAVKARLTKSYDHKNSSVSPATVYYANQKMR